MFKARTSTAARVAHRSLRSMFVTFASVAACSLPSEPAVKAALTTDRIHYVGIPMEDSGTVIHYGFTVITRVRNTSMAPLYFETCGATPIVPFGVELVEYRDPAGSAYDAAWSCPAGDVEVLSPGEERTDTLQLRGPMLFDGSRQPAVPLGRVEGRMRISFAARTCSRQIACTSDAALVPILLRSNAFEVSVASTQ
jgi:hypothetical protein